ERNAHRLRAAECAAECSRPRDFAHTVAYSVSTSAAPDGKHARYTDCCHCGVEHLWLACHSRKHPLLAPGEIISTISSTSGGRGYWLFSNEGRAFQYGDAKFFGDMHGRHLNGAIIASVATPTGRGYYMVGSDGGIFTFGDARFRGSTGNRRLNKPI